jgi:hypothetical protein
VGGLKARHQQRRAAPGVTDSTWGLGLSLSIRFVGRCPTLLMTGFQLSLPGYSSEENKSQNSGSLANRTVAFSREKHRTFVEKHRTFVEKHDLDQ